jgi:hypothetical protein
MTYTSHQLHYVHLSAGVLTCGGHHLNNEHVDLVRHWYRSGIESLESDVDPDGRPWPPMSEESRLIAASNEKELLATLNPGFAFGRVAKPFRWWCSRKRTTLASSISIPIWMIGVIPAACAVILWTPAVRRVRRRRRNLCLACGYPRSDLPANAPCPECGENVIGSEHAGTNPPHGT